MQGEKTVKVSAYITPLRSSRDRVIMAKLRSDRARGVGYSESIKRALEKYYDPDAPTPAQTAQSDAIADALGALTAQVAQLTAQVAALQAQAAKADALATEVGQLRIALLGAVYGDRTQKQTAQAVASSVLAVMTQPSGNGNGNGNGNGHG